MGVLDSLKTDATIEKDTDRVGGGFSVLDSDVYALRVKSAYIHMAASKAMAMNVQFETIDGKALRAQFYMTSGEAKGCKNYYEKDGKKHYLPGFNQANALCLLTVGKEVGTMAVEKKVLPLYNFDQGKEVPTEVDVFTELTGKEIFAGVINQLVDKKAKNTTTGAYEPTGETKAENEVDKFFRAKDKLTVVEITAQVTTPDFIEKWTTKWKDQVKDKTSKTGVVAGKPAVANGTAAPATSLFA